MSTPILKPLLKPLLILLGTTSMIFFGGVIALTLPTSGLEGKNTPDNLTTAADAPSPSSSPLVVETLFTPQSMSSETEAVAASTATISAEQAMMVATQYLPNASLQAPVELVNYNGSVAYEVSLTSGVVYVDAASAELLNPPPSAINTTEDYKTNQHHDEEDYEDKHNEDKHREDKHHNRKKHQDRDEASTRLIVADYRHHQKSDRDSKHHDEEAYDD